MWEELAVMAGLVQHQILTGMAQEEAAVAMEGEVAMAEAMAMGEEEEKVP